MLTGSLTASARARQIKVANSLFLPYVLHRGGVLEAAAVRATPRFGSADNEPRFSNVFVRCPAAPVNVMIPYYKTVAYPMPMPGRRHAPLLDSAPCSCTECS